MRSTKDNLAEKASARGRRAERRRARIVATVSSSFDEAEAWDLQYWQALSPQARLSALVAIHRDMMAVKERRRQAETAGP